MIFGTPSRTVSTILLPAALSFLANLANAKDLSSFRICVERRYKAMTDRIGIVAAVLDDVDSQVMTFGAGSKDQPFELGSITKILTANLLAQFVLEGKLKLSDPIPAAYQKSGATITYRHLTTHTSGITPGNFPDHKSANPLFPFEGITIPVFKELYAKTPLLFTPGESWAYSNAGVSLLGLILAERAGTSYEDLVWKRIFAPVGMTESYFHLSHISHSEVGLLAEGHLIFNKGPAIPAPYWDLSENAFAPAGGLRSTIGDMIKFARANLMPETTTIGKSVTLAQEPLYSVNDGLTMGMNWMIDPKSDVLWHHGATGGFNSIIALSKKAKRGVVALTSTAAYISDVNGKPDIDLSFGNVALDCLKSTAQAEASGSALSPLQ